MKFQKPVRYISQSIKMSLLQSTLFEQKNYVVDNIVISILDTKSNSCFIKVLLEKGNAEISLIHLHDFL